MSTFKQKPNKLKYRSDATTVHERHTNMLADFNQNEQSIPYKKRKILDLQNKLNFDQHLSLTEKSHIMSQIKSLENDIFQYQDSSELLNYASKIGDVLINYYEITSSIHYNPDEIKDKVICEDIDTTNEKSDNVESTQQPSKLDKLIKLNEISKQSRKIKKKVKKRRIVQPTSSSKPILQFLPTQFTQPVQSNQAKSIDSINKPEQIVSKAVLLHKYLMAIDKEYACGKVKAEKITCCPDCKKTKGIDVEKILFQSEGCFVCKECGHTQHTVMESELPSHKELANEKQKYPYKKINHLKEKLNQFQSKESADVGDDICLIVKADLKKMGIDYRRATPPTIRQILKKHKWTNLYEHVQQIYCKVTGNKPITLTSEIEEAIINMFQSMQDSFRKHCPKTRSNFLSYSYVLNKLFRILKMPEHAKYFGLLKSKEKLRDQDFIWNKICKDMSWDFYSSF